MEAHQDSFEFFDIMGDQMVQTNFNKSVTGYKQAKITVPVKHHNDMRNLIHEIKELNSYYIQSGYTWYYLIHSEIIKLLRNSAIIKFNNHKLTSDFDDFTSNDIGDLLYQMLLYSQTKNREKIENHIENEIMAKISADYSIWDNNSIHTIISSLKYSVGDVSFVYDALIGFPHIGRTVKTLYSCTKFDTHAGVIDQTDSLLSTKWKWEKEQMATEFAEHILYDNNYDEKLKKLCKQYSVHYREELMIQNSMLVVLRKLMSGKIEFDLDYHIPDIIKSSLYKARATVALAEKSKFGVITRECNVCGGNPAIVHNNKLKWFWCKKHGYCHIACVGLGFICCPHC